MVLEMDDDDEDMKFSDFIILVFKIYVCIVIFFVFLILESNVVFMFLYDLLIRRIDLEKGVFM